MGNGSKGWASRHQVGMLACFAIGALLPGLFGRPAEVAAAGSCKAGRRIIAPRKPARAPDGSIQPGQSIVQARITVGGKATVRVVEHPRSGEPLDSYHSTIVVRKGRVEKQYPLEHLIKRGEFFRLVETAKLCSPRGTGTVFLAFEAGSTGASEGFVVVRYSRLGITVQALPVADQGRIVVRSPTEVELWTAQGEQDTRGIECDACKKRYAVKDCRLGQSEVHCSSSARQAGSLSPDKFMQARIKVR